MSESTHKKDSKILKKVPSKRYSKHKSAYNGLKKNLNKNDNLWKIVTGVLVVLLLFSVISGNNSDDETMEKTGFFSGVKDFFSGLSKPSTPVDADVTKTGIVKFDVYVMSQCPYGTPAMDGAIEAKKQLGDAMELTIGYIGSTYDSVSDFDAFIASLPEDYKSYYQSQCHEKEDGKLYCALHGEPEVNGNIVQLCGMNQDEAKGFDMITCMNQNPSAIPGNWESCAGKAGLDVETVRTCYEGQEGRDLLSAAYDVSAALGVGASPTVFVNDVQQQTSPDKYLKAICGKLTDHPTCSAIPEAVKFTMTFISDEICDECTASVAQNQGILSQLFEGVEYVTLDFEDANAKAMMEKYDISLLPAVVVDLEVENTAAWKGEQINTAVFEKKADKYVVLPQVIGSEHNPLGEVCSNGVDDRDQDGLVDCADDECVGSMDCREEVSQNLQVFIMSDCPYGRKAIEAVKEVADNFGTEMDLEVHYIASENPDGSFNSLHGAYEAEENMRQLCVKEYSPDVWFDYMYCRSTNGVSGVDWNDCATETGVDATAVDACVTGGEGAALHSEDILIAQSLGIGASPTWLTNNKYQFSGISPEGIKASFCQYNSELSGCGNTLSGDAGTVSGSC